MKASWRHLGFVLIATQAVGCFGVRYRDSMELPTCGAESCQADAGASGGLGGRHGGGEENQLVAYDQPMIPPRAKFHPVPTRPVFAPRVEYSPPQLIRTPVLVEAPQGPILMAPGPDLKPTPIETPQPVPPPGPMSKPLAPLAPATEANRPTPLAPATEAKTPSPLPPPTVHAKPIIAPLPQPIDLDQPLEIQPIQGVWRVKRSS